MQYATLHNDMSNTPKGRYPHSSAGFTLIEILVVVAIMGVVMGMVSLAIKSDVDILEKEQERLAAIISLLNEESILQARDYGISFWDKGYAFYEYDEERWQRVRDDRKLRARELPKDVEVQLIIEDIDVVMDVHDKGEPQVFVLSSGEMSPFTAVLSWDNEIHREFSFDALGSLKMPGDDDDDNFLDDDF